MAKSHKEVKDFHGRFALHLLNLLRSITRTKRPLVIDITFKNKKEGKIFFDNGELVHAEFGDKTGEAAFFAIVEGRDGTYEKIRGVTADVVSIERDARTLLAEFKSGEPAPRKQDKAQLEFPEIERAEEEAKEEPSEDEEKDDLARQVDEAFSRFIDDIKTPELAQEEGDAEAVEDAGTEVENAQEVAGSSGEPERAQVAEQEEGGAEEVLPEEEEEEKTGQQQVTETTAPDMEIGEEPGEGSEEGEEHDDHAFPDDADLAQIQQAAEGDVSPETTEAEVKVESGEVPVEVAAEPAGADRWIPPETPKYGLQEEFWLVDWGKGTRGFISAYILKPDGEKIMGSDQAEVRNTEGAADLLRAAPVFLEWGERWNSIRLESAEKMLYIVSLAEHYLLVVTLDARSAEKEASERRLQALIESLNETLRKA